MSRRWLRAAGLIVLLTLVLAAVFAVFGSHGHGRDLLEGAVAVVVASPDMIRSEFFPRWVESALQVVEQDPDYAPWPVGAARTTEEPVTTVRAAVYFTVYRVASVTVYRTNSGPQALVVERADGGGRFVVPIEREPSRVETDGAAPRWRLDLGRIVVPRGG